MTLINYECRKLFCHKGIIFILLFLWVAAQFAFSQSQLMQASAIEADESEKYAADYVKYGDISLDESVEKLGDEQGFGYYNFLSEIKSRNEYVNGYSNYIETVLSQADQMEQAAVFQKKGSFAISNIRKTKADFAVLEGLEVSDAPAFWVRNVICWKNGAWFLLVQMIVIAAAVFGLEQKSGVRNLCEIQYLGRKPTVMAKLCALLFLTLAAVLINIAGFAVQAIFACGLGDVSASIQSLEEFKRCALPFSCAQMLVIFIAASWLVLCMLGALLSFLIWESALGVGCALFAMVMAVSWLLNRHLPENEIFLILREANFYSWLFIGEWLKSYQNVNFFGRAVHYSLCFTVGVFGCIAMWTALLWIFAESRAAKPLFVQRLNNAGPIVSIKRVVGRLKSESTSIFKYQLYEAFFYRWRIIIPIIFAAATICAVGKQNDGYYSMKKATYDSYMLTLQGLYSQEKEEFLEKEQLFMQGIDEDTLAIQEKYADGELDEDEYTHEITALEREREQKNEGYVMLESQWRRVKARAESGDESAGFFNELLAEKLFSRNSESIKCAFIVLTFAVVFLLSYQLIEYPCTELIRANYRGRKQRIHSRLAVNIAIMLIAQCFVSWRYFSGILGEYTGVDFNVSTACVSELSALGANMTVKDYMILRLILQCIGAVLAAVLLTALAQLKQRPVVQYCLAGILLLFPAVLLKLRLPFALGGLACFECIDFIDTSLAAGVLLWCAYAAVVIAFFAVMTRRTTSTR